MEHLRDPGSRTTLLHMVVVAALSAAFESLFLRSGLNPMDEGWPLYAAMQLHAGGQLYRDVFWVFPPGHVVAGWIGYGLAPPGLVPARVLYAASTVALCVTLYFLGRRITTPGYALLGACLAAVAAPASHHSQLIFGYRYLVFSALALWFFSERLRTGSPRWMAAAGAAAGTALVFRIDPPAAVTAGIGLAVLGLRLGWRALWRDAAAFAVGFAAVVGPVLLWLLLSVGPETLWLEVVVRPMEMHRRQGKPFPPLEWPRNLGIWAIRSAFVSLQFRLWSALYLAYAAALALGLARALRGRRPFEQPLLLAIVVWGGMFFSRSLIGRSDEPHLDSAVPPVLLLAGHAVGLAAARLRWRPARLALAPALFAAWVWLTALPFYPAAMWSEAGAVETLGGGTRFQPYGHLWGNFDEVVRAIQARTRPDDVVLDLTASPLFHVASGRRGPGWADLVMPGTFLSEAEELALIERLERRRPALVVTSQRPFDEKIERSPAGHAPRLWIWVGRHYRKDTSLGRFSLLVPRESP